MPKVSINKLQNKVYDLILFQLASAFKKGTDENKVTTLLNSLFTETEKLMLAKRLAIALLLEKNVTYEKISRLLKVSPVTVGFIRNKMRKGNKEYLEFISKLSDKMIRVSGATTQLEWFAHMEKVLKTRAKNK
jgi:uncharacterized protein YerC